MYSGFGELFLFEYFMEKIGIINPVLYTNHTAMCQNKHVYNNYLVYIIYRQGAPATAPAAMANHPKEQSLCATVVVRKATI
jgi:hypothetical protein